jgi:hypothetical protein
MHAIGSIMDAEKPPLLSTPLITHPLGCGCNKCSYPLEPRGTANAIRDTGHGPFVVLYDSGAPHQAYSTAPARPGPSVAGALQTGRQSIQSDMEAARAPDTRSSAAHQQVGTHTTRGGDIKSEYHGLLIASLDVFLTLPLVFEVACFDADVAIEGIYAILASGASLYTKSPILRPSSLEARQDCVDGFTVTEGGIGKSFGTSEQVEQVEHKSLSVNGHQRQPASPLKTDALEEGFFKMFRKDKLPDAKEEPQHLIFEKVCSSLEVEMAPFIPELYVDNTKFIKFALSIIDRCEGYAKGPLLTQLLQLQGTLSEMAAGSKEAIKSNEPVKYGAVACGCQHNSIPPNIRDRLGPCLPGLDSKHAQVWRGSGSGSRPSLSLRALALRSAGMPTENLIEWLRGSVAEAELASRCEPQCQSTMVAGIQQHGPSPATQPNHKTGAHLSAVSRLAHDPPTVPEITCVCSQGHWSQLSTGSGPMPSGDQQTAAIHIEPVVGTPPSQPAHSAQSTMTIITEQVIYPEVKVRDVQTLEAVAAPKHISTAEDSKIMTAATVIPPRVNGADFLHRTEMLVPETSWDPRVQSQHHDLVEQSQFAISLNSFNPPPPVVESTEPLASGGVTVRLPELVTSGGYAVLFFSSMDAALARSARPMQVRDAPLGPFGRALHGYDNLWDALSLCTPAHGAIEDSHHPGNQYVVVCAVALGRTYEASGPDATLRRAPLGFQSVAGPAGAGMHGRVYAVYESHRVIKLALHFVTHSRRPSVFPLLAKVYAAPTAARNPSAGRLNNRHVGVAPREVVGDRLSPPAPRALEPGDNTMPSPQNHNAQAAAEVAAPADTAALQPPAPRGRQVMMPASLRSFFTKILSKATQESHQRTLRHCITELLDRRMSPEDFVERISECLGSRPPPSILANLSAQLNLVREAPG